MTKTLGPQNFSGSSHVVSDSLESWLEWKKFSRVRSRINQIIKERNLSTVSFQPYKLVLKACIAARKTDIRRNKV